MPTTKKRINITLKKGDLKMLMALARHDEVPVATKAKELMEEILEFYEDQVWLEMAEERLKEGGKMIPFEEVDWS